MVRKLGPRRGARSRATSRPIPAEIAVEQLERRTKRRNDPAEQPGSSSAPQRASKRGRTSTSGRGSHSPNPRQDIQGSSSQDPEESSSSSESSESQEEEITSESRIAAKHILKPRILDLTDNELANSFPEIRTLFAFQSWLIFISDFPIFYPRLVQEFYKHLKCTKFEYKSVVKGIQIDLPTDLAATLFHAPDEGENCNKFQFDLHEAYTLLTGLPSDESDPKQTHVTKYNTNTFSPSLRIIHHMLTTIITPQGGGRDRLTETQRFILFCMKKNIKVNLHDIMYQIMSETIRKNLKRSLPYAAHLTSVFEHFGVPLAGEKSQVIPKSNIYCFKNIKKFMGFRLKDNQIRRGPVLFEASDIQEDQPQVQEDLPQEQEDQPPHVEGQPQIEEEQPLRPEYQQLVDEDQPQLSPEGDILDNSPISPHFVPSSSIHPDLEPPNFQASTSSGGSSIPPELLSFLNSKFDALNSSIHTMSERIEVRIKRLENRVSANFIEQKAASDYAAQRFNRLIGSLVDASEDLKEHQQKLEIVLQGILANSQADVFNTTETLSQLNMTRCAFAHLADDLESMKNFNAHLDNQISELKMEFKILSRPGWSVGSSSTSQPATDDLLRIQDNLMENTNRMEHFLQTKLTSIHEQMKSSMASMEKRMSVIETILLLLLPHLLLNVQALFAKGVSTHPSMVSTQQHRFKGKMSTHSSEQVDTRSRSQNSCFVNWDRRSTHSQSVSTQDNFPAVQVVNFQTSYKRFLSASLQKVKGPNSLRASKKLLAAKKSPCLLPLLSKCFQKTNSHQFKHSKEADPIEDFFGEEFEEDPTSQLQSIDLDFKFHKSLPNSSLYKGVH
ncbi:hypothetical protein Taro_007699 [Colocasia esculenta]|uniref:Putative plant transposon protein domain-containing protein n=1 Tax=Colocasia esculenta TaxID=4460 RepID=A0A843TW66_COLES|nr:hypothetical protein [Colocasia esculenta]